MANPEADAFSMPPLSPELLERPLDYLVADHDRHRALCVHLRRVAQQEEIDGASARDISRFLKEDLKRHFEDERLSLYPALRSRSADDPEFLQSLQEIEAFHARTAPFVDDLIAQFDRLAGKNRIRLPHELSERLAEYAEREHQSLAFENGVIMVIAGVRLKKSDIEKLRNAMKTRRGLAPP